VTPKKSAKRKSKAARKKPSPNGNNGRDKSGKFTVGNKGGPGNPHSRQVAAFRSVLMRAFTQEDMEAVAQMLIRKSRAGDMAATKELLDRVMGKATQPIDADINISWGDKTTEEVMEAAAQALRDAGWTVEPPK